MSNILKYCFLEFFYSTNMVKMSIIGRTEMTLVRSFQVIFESDHYHVANISTVNKMIMLILLLLFESSKY